MKYLILLIALILRSLVIYLRNLVYFQKVKILEELLDSKLYCTYSILHPVVKIKGKYKGRTINFKSYPSGLSRGSMFIYKSSKLPKQKKFVFNYPKVGNNITQENKMLVYRVVDLFTSQLSSIGKDGICAIMNEILKTAERIEVSYE